MKLLKPGEKYFDYHKEVQKITERELIGLKLIDKKDEKLTTVALDNLCEGDLEYRLLRRRRSEA